MPSTAFLSANCLTLSASNHIFLEDSVLNDLRFFDFMTRRLVSQKCRAVIAMSQSARKFFLHMHASSPYYDELRKKLHVRMPNIIIDPSEDAYNDSTQEPIRVCFVGQHFGRKGGCVSLRMAELAIQRKLPLCFDIVSNFVVGRKSWTDPVDPEYFTHI